MYSATIRRITSIFMIAALAAGFVILAGALTQEDAHAAVAKAAVKKAKTYKKKANKLFKVGSAWYCFSSKKVKKGLQKVGKEYYFFNKSTGKMLVKSKLMKIGTAYYYFQKKSGKAPALRNTAKKTGEEVWFFQSNGKRYEYSYKDTGSAAGNTAAGYIISEAKIKADGTGSWDQTSDAYARIIQRSSYRITGEPDLTSADTSWIGKYAKDCAANKGGKCYGFAALTYVTFRALGNPTTQLLVGKCQTRPGQTDPETGEEYAPTAHAWVLAMDTETYGGLYAYDSVYDVTKSNKDMSFCGKTVYADEGFQTHMIDGKDYIYYIDMML